VEEAETHDDREGSHYVQSFEMWLCQRKSSANGHAHGGSADALVISKDEHDRQPAPAPSSHSRHVASLARAPPQTGNDAAGEGGGVGDFDISFEEPTNTGLPPCNFEVRHEFTESAVLYASLQFCAEMDLYFLVILPACFMGIMAYLAYGVGLRNILDRITLADRRVKLELHDAVNSASTCWQFYLKDDPTLAVLEPRAPTLCEAHLAGSSVAGSSNRVPTLAFVIVFAGLLTAAAFCVRYLLAGIDVLKHWLLSGRREMSGRGKMARSVGGVKRS
jgi:hypothetical protein